MGGPMLGPVQEPNAAFIIPLQLLYGHSWCLHNSWPVYVPPPPPALTVLISTYAQAVTHTDSDVRTPFMAVQILNRSWSVLLRERPKVSESLWKSEDRCGEKVLQETRRSQPCFYFFCSKMFQFHQWPFSPPISSLTVDFCCLHFIWAWPRSWRDAHFCLSWLIPGWSR